MNILTYTRGISSHSKSTDRKNRGQSIMPWPFLCRKTVRLFGKSSPWPTWSGRSVMLNTASFSALPSYLSWSHLLYLYNVFWGLIWCLFQILFKPFLAPRCFWRPLYFQFFIISTFFRSTIACLGFHIIVWALINVRLQGAYICHSIISFDIMITNKCSKNNWKK